MPARRSRTLNWKDSLRRICDRNGPIEITLDTGDRRDARQPFHVIWRVRLLEMTDHEIVIEEPSALDVPVHLRDGLDLIGIMTVGQNRWMFRARVLGRTSHQLSHNKDVTAYRISTPTRVERCQRRNFYRVSTARLELPPVVLGHIADLDQARLIEEAARSEMLRLIDHEVAARIGEPDPTLEPPLGPSCRAKLVNIGGGGAGLAVEPEDQRVLETARYVWLSIDLRPQLPAPLGLIARVRHTRTESNGVVYAGVSFETHADARQERFVADLLCRFVAEVQRTQLRRRIGTDEPLSGLGG